MMGFWLDIQEDRQDGKKYTLDTANGVVSANVNNSTNNNLTS